MVSTPGKSDHEKQESFAAGIRGTCACYSMKETSRPTGIIGFVRAFSFLHPHNVKHPDSSMWTGQFVHLLLRLV